MLNNSSPPRGGSRKKRRSYIYREREQCRSALHIDKNVCLPATRAKDFLSALEHDSGQLLCLVRAIDKGERVWRRPFLARAAQLSLSPALQGGKGRDRNLSAPALAHLIPKPLVESESERERVCSTWLFKSRPPANPRASSQPES